MCCKHIIFRLKLLFLTILCISFAGTSVYADSISNKDATQVYYIRLSEEIMPAAGRLIKKGIDEAIRQKADVIVFEINTYGGRLDIADSIRSKILYTPIKTVAFINNNAASAGALISLACDSIYMVPGASIGAATAVEGMSGEAAPDKYQSYMRGMMRSTAETKGRDPRIAEAMVDEQIEIPGINQAGKVLTLTAQEAVRLDMADGIVNDLDEVLKKIDVRKYTLTSHQQNSVDAAINFLLNPLVNSILILLIIGGIYFELKTPGIGLPILVSLTAAILYFAPLIIDGTAQVWEILLFLAGIVLLLLEIFVIPGFGVAGIAGIICIIAGLTFSLVSFSGTDFEFNSIAGDLLVRAFFRVMLIISISLVVLFFFGGSILNMPGFNKVILKDAQDNEKGYTIKNEALYRLIGAEGVVFNQLRPSGKVLIDNELYEAISQSSFLDKDEKIKVIGVDGYSLRVKKV